LENHISTITEFINKYRKLDGNVAQKESFWKISAYLSLVSWPKMYRRITNWTSKGYIYLLSSLPFDELRYSFQRYTPGSASNNDFHETLSSFCEDERVVKRLLNFLNYLHYPALKAAEKPQDLNKLLTALKAEKSGDVDSAYNEETCIVLHLLLLALLVGLGHSLTKYHVAYKAVQKREKKEGKKAKEEMRMLAIHFWEYGRLLWELVSSQMFDDHIHVLLGTTLNARTVWFHNQDLYSSVVGFDDLPGRKIVQGHSNVDPGCSEQNKKNSNGVGKQSNGKSGCVCGAGVG